MICAASLAPQLALLPFWYMAMSDLSSDVQLWRIDKSATTKKNLFI